MALVFNQARERQCVNPYGVKFKDSYFESAHAELERGKVIASRAPLPEKSSGKFIITSDLSMDRVSVSAAVWIADCCDLRQLAGTNETPLPKGRALALLDGNVNHGDVFTIIKILNPELSLDDPCFLSAGMVSIDQTQRRLQAGLGSLFGMLPRSLLIDAFSDLAEKLGCDFEPANPFDTDRGAFRQKSDSERWFRKFDIPR